MNKLNLFFNIQATISIFIGAFLIVITQNKVMGAAIGFKDIKPSINILFGFFFLIAGISLYLVQKRK